MHSPGNSWPRALPQARLRREERQSPSHHLPWAHCTWSLPHRRNPHRPEPLPSRNPWLRPVAVWMECNLGGRSQVLSLDWPFPRPHPTAIALAGASASTITRTPMRPTKPSLNVAASGIPGGSYNTLIKIPTTPFLQSLTYLSTSAHAVRPAPLLSTYCVQEGGWCWEGGE